MKNNFRANKRADTSGVKGSSQHDSDFPPWKVEFLYWFKKKPLSEVLESKSDRDFCQII